ncbi:transglutaminase-like cysteine peptidase, partial [Rhizobiaceae sp. 2RAB30]
APRTDMEMWGREEFWSYPDGVGDCEDYVLEKRRELMKLGIPAGDLLITVVRQPNGDGHAVLTVRTGQGDYVLDNLESRVLAWSDTEYTYLKRQSERNSGTWITINDGRAIAVGSVPSQ